MDNCTKNLRSFLLSPPFPITGLFFISKSPHPEKQKANLIYPKKKSPPKELKEKEYEIDNNMSRRALSLEDLQPKMLEPKKTTTGRGKNLRLQIDPEWLAVEKKAAITYRPWQQAGSEGKKKVRFPYKPVFKK